MTLLLKYSGVGSASRPFTTRLYTQSLHQVRQPAVFAFLVKLSRAVVAKWYHSSSLSVYDSLIDLCWCVVMLEFCPYDMMRIGPLPSESSNIDMREVFIVGRCIVKCNVLECFSPSHKYRIQPLTFKPLHISRHTVYLTFKFITTNQCSYRCKNVGWVGCIVLAADVIYFLNTFLCLDWWGVMFLPQTCNVFLGKGLR